MFNIIKRKNKEELKDKYELTKSVKIADVKQYLKNEYDRAAEREALIAQLEDKIEKGKTIEAKYDAMLVVQEETTKRIKTQDKSIKEYRAKIDKLSDEIKLLNSKMFDIKANAEKKLKERDDEIGALKKEIASLSKKKKEKK